MGQTNPPSYLYMDTFGHVISLTGQISNKNREKGKKKNGRRINQSKWVHYYYTLLVIKLLKI